MGTVNNSIHDRKIASCCQRIRTASLHRCSHLCDIVIPSEAGRHRKGILEEQIAAIRFPPVPLCSISAIDGLSLFHHADADEAISGIRQRCFVPNETSGRSAPVQAGCSTGTTSTCTSISSLPGTGSDLPHGGAVQWTFQSLTTLYKHVCGTSAAGIGLQCRPILRIQPSDWDSNTWIVVQLTSVPRVLRCLIPRSSLHIAGTGNGAQSSTDPCPGHDA